VNVPATSDRAVSQWCRLWSALQSDYVMSRSDNLTLSNAAVTVQVDCFAVWGTRSSATSRRAMLAEAAAP
jgi:hypothetical protein